MKKKSVIGAIAVVFVFAAVWWWRKPAKSPPGIAAAAPPPAAASRPKSDGPAPSAEDRAKAESIVAEITAGESQRFSSDRVAQNYRNAASITDRWKALAELRDPRFPREDVVRVLKSALADSAVKIRVNAAELLYQLGSADGKDALFAALGSASSFPPEELPDVLHAAEVLNRNQVALPETLLVGLYRELGPRGILPIMAMQGDPAFAPYLTAAAKEDPAGMVFLLGVSGLADGGQMARELFATTQNNQVKVSAAWTVFETTGDRAGLDYVLQIAEHQVNAGGAADASPAAVQQAVRELAITDDPAVLDFLRRAATVNDLVTNSAALASLFYVHQDYAFVDDYVGRYLADPKAYPQVDPALIGHIVAARNQPQLNILVEQASPTLRQLYFDPAPGVPVTSWIRRYLDRLPFRTGSR